MHSPPYHPYKTTCLAPAAATARASTDALAPRGVDLSPRPNQNKTSAEALLRGGFQPFCCREEGPTPHPSKSSHLVPRHPEGRLFEAARLVWRHKLRKPGALRRPRRRLRRAREALLGGGTELRRGHTWLLGGERRHLLLGGLPGGLLGLRVRHAEAHVAVGVLVWSGLGAVHPPAPVSSEDATGLGADAATAAVCLQVQGAALLGVGRLADARIELGAHRRLRVVLVLPNHAVSLRHLYPGAGAVNRCGRRLGNGLRVGGRLRRACGRAACSEAWRLHWRLHWGGLA